MKAFITSQPRYCPLVWCSAAKEYVKKINALHEMA